VTSPRPGGLVELTAFFAFGAVMSLLTALRDLRTLIGIPIGLGLLWYLRQLRRRGQFVRVP
jgi:hypothetical protein